MKKKVWAKKKHFIIIIVLPLTPVGGDMARITKKYRVVDVIEV